MQPDLKLSICIPTRNRAAYLEELLKSIFAQNLQGVEVIISDNASTDGTAALAAKYPGVIYHKNYKNIGFDANVIKVISYARAPYCWLMGDDDILYPGAINYLLNKLREGFAFYAISFDICDGRMKHLQKGGYLIKEKDGEVFDFSRRQGALAYLERVKANAGLFGFMGGVIFRREAWLKINPPKELMGLGWIHIFFFWSILQSGVKAKFLAEPLMKLRLQYQNTTQAKTRLSRLLMEFKGLQKTAALLFKKDKEVYNAFLAAVTRYTAPSSIPPYFTLSKEDKKLWPQFIACLQAYPYPQSFKKSLENKKRLNFIYFAREFINQPALRRIKKPFKLLKDSIKG